MKRLTALVVLFGISSTAVGEVSSRVCLADGNTPLELADPNVPFVYRDIMVGTRLTIIVDSNLDGVWDGDLAIEGEYRDYGLLSARDYNDNTGDWEGSHFEAAGSLASVIEWLDLGIHGFTLQSHESSVPGDWFIIDYTASRTGVCKVGFYDHSVSWDYPIYELVFSHARTRDFDNDTRVGLLDFALFALYWLEADCGDPDWCAGTDLDTDGDVDRDDLLLFVDYWLERTE